VAATEPYSAAMAEAENPFRPGLGLDPPVLAGREEALCAAEGLLDALERLDAGVPVILVGLVGSGRTRPAPSWRRWSRWPATRPMAAGRSPSWERACPRSELGSIGGSAAWSTSARSTGRHSTRPSPHRSAVWGPASTRPPSPRSGSSQRVARYSSRPPPRRHGTRPAVSGSRRRTSRRGGGAPSRASSTGSSPARWRTWRPTSAATCERWPSSATPGCRPAPSPGGWATAGGPVGSVPGWPESGCSSSAWASSTPSTATASTSACRCWAATCALRRARSCWARTES
jgi:hypothetical protein